MSEEAIKLLPYPSYFRFSYYCCNCGQLFKSLQKIKLLRLQLCPYCFSVKEGFPNENWMADGNVNKIQFNIYQTEKEKEFLEYSLPPTASIPKRNRRYFRKIRAIILLGGCCEACGETKPICLDFHHRLPAFKKYNLSYIFDRMTDIEFEEDGIEEIKKCSLLCVNCHRQKHFKKAQQRYGVLLGQNYY